MDLTASSAVNLPMISDCLRLVVIRIGLRSIRCTYSGIRTPPRLTLTRNWMIFIGFLSTWKNMHDIKLGADFKPSPRFLSLSYWRLGGLAVNFGFECLLAANVNLDLLGLGFRLLGQINLQHALVVVGGYLSRIHRVGQSERAREASILPLHAPIVLFFLVFFELALAVHGESIALDANVNIFLVNTRDFHLKRNRVLIFVYVHRRGKAGGDQGLFRAFWAERLTEKTVHTVQTILQAGKFTDRFPTGH